MVNRKGREAMVMERGIFYCCIICALLGTERVVNWDCKAECKLWLGMNGGAGKTVGSFEYKVEDEGETLQNDWTHFSFDISCDFPLLCCAVSRFRSTKKLKKCI